MTQIDFHFNARERLQYTCRLLRKVHAQALRVGVVGSEASLRQLDVALWSFSEASFLPHSTAADDPEIQQASPIRLHGDPDQLSGMDVLVNLGDEVPPGFDAFPRLVEIVATDEHGRMMARQRWRHYTHQGYALIQHDLSKLEAS
ncbi:DNA polymerase III subunit chi [Limnohabitans sp. DCL3]|uniref:DNA polymerase III subunit chi n=1 Tax=Limnohabitans sp. DCL3 TaxID=3374103 RepID=UPI003A8B2E61